MEATLRLVPHRADLRVDAVEHGDEPLHLARAFLKDARFAARQLAARHAGLDALFLARLPGVDAGKVDAREGLGRSRDRRR